MKKSNFNSSLMSTNLNPEKKIIGLGNSVLITGGTNGIGKELAVLIKKKHPEIRVKVIGREDESLKNLALLGIEGEKIDLSVQSDRNRFLENWENFDVVVNNAGFGWVGEFKNQSFKNIESMIEVNIQSLVQITQKALNSNVKTIVQIASTAAFQPGPFMAVYYATKAFVLSFSEAISFENPNVKMITICPGPTKTEFQRRADALDLNLFSAPMPSAKDLAFFIYEKIQNPKRVAIYGLSNKILRVLSHFTPNCLLMHVIAFLQKKKSSK